MRAPLRIVFVCTGNTGRSVMAAALAEALVRHRNLPIDVRSRGLAPDPAHREVETNAALLLRAEGIEVAQHRATAFTAVDVITADLILTATLAQRAEVITRFGADEAKTHTLSQFAAGVDSDIADAFAQPMAVYQQVFTQIRGYVPMALDRAAPN